MRRRFALAVALAVIGLGFVVHSSTAHADQAASSPTPVATPAATDPSTSDSGSGQGPCAVPVAGSLCGVGQGIQDIPGDTLTGVGDSITSAITAWVAGGAIWFVQHVVSAVMTSTVPNPDAHWFAANYVVMTQLAAFFVVIFLLIGTVEGLIHNDLGGIVRAYLLRAPAALIGTAVAVAVTGQLLAVTDAMSAAVSAHTAGTFSAFATEMSAVLVVTSGQPLFAIFVASVAVVFTALLVWLELLVRATAVDVCLLFFPLALAALVWPAAAGVARRLVEMLIAIILSKFVIVAVLGLGISAMAAGNGDGGVSSALVGALMFALAAYTPYKLFRLLPAIQVVAASGLGRNVHRASSRAWSGGRTAATGWNGATRSAGAGSAAAGSSGAVAVVGAQLARQGVARVTEPSVVRAGRNRDGGPTPAWNRPDAPAGDRSPAADRRPGPTGDGDG